MFRSLQEVCKEWRGMCHSVAMDSQVEEQGMFAFAESQGVVCRVLYYES